MRGLKRIGQHRSKHAEPKNEIARRNRNKDPVHIRRGKRLFYVFPRSRYIMVGMSNAVIANIK